jgi:hypothetical protein
MEIVQSIAIIAGLTSVALLWVLSIVGIMQVLWDTFGEGLAASIAKFRK